jgi:glycosyltransferase involved in cell wall biosynthesis
MGKLEADRKIHVLFLLISQSVGGAEIHTVSLANGLDKAKFRVSVAFLKDEQDGTDLSHLLSDQVTVFCANMMRRLDVGGLRMLCSYAKKENVDIVACTNTFPLFYGWLVVRLLRIKITLAEVFHTTELDTLKTKLQMIFYRPFFHAADHVVFVCEAQRAYWRSRKLELSFSSVIHNGIDVSRFRNDFTNGEISSVRARFGFAESDFVVGICASLRPEKAHIDLLDALILLKDQGYNFKCMIIGSGPERDRIERAIIARHLQNDVVLTGFIADVRIYVAACDVMVLASHYIETFSLSALEAMALGKPMIMSEVGGAAEQVTHGYNGLLFPAGDTRALANAMLAVKKENADGKMSVNARKSVVERFSSEKMISTFEKTFLAMAGQEKSALSGSRSSTREKFDG